MKTLHNQHFSVIAEEDFPKKIVEISEQLNSCRHEGTFLSFDSKELYYEYFQVPNSRGAVVIVHGLSEFTQKYHEFAWYLLNQGYDVFLYDQRCHGRSCRLTPHYDMIHVEHFTDYQKDLHQFIVRVVKKATDLPLYLYAHSMGGAVAVQYLEKHPDVFQKAVLSAPMFRPLTRNVSPLIAKIGLSAYLIFGDSKKKFWQSNEFDPHYPFSQAQDKSFARFKWYMDLRIKNTCYRTTPMSMRWVQQSLVLQHSLMKKRLLKKIKTPILMLCADNDGVVSKDSQVKLAKKCPACEMIIIPNSTHTMLSGTPKIITAHIQYVLHHFI